MKTFHRIINEENHEEIRACEDCVEPEIEDRKNIDKQDWQIIDSYQDHYGTEVCDLCGCHYDEDEDDWV